MLESARWRRTSSTLSAILTLLAQRSPSSSRVRAILHISVPAERTGTSIAAYGSVGPGYGSYGITLDGVEKAEYNAARQVDAHHQLMTFITSLDDTRAHTLEIINKGSTLLAIDSWTVWGDDVATFGYEYWCQRMRKLNQLQ